MKNESSYPFYSWLPKSVGAFILVLMFVPATFSGGIYMNNLAEMAGAMAVQNETIQLASYFTSIGMCLFPPFMVGFMRLRRPKHLFMQGFALMLLFNFIIATTDNTLLLLIACTLTGFVRVMVMMNITFTLSQYLLGMDSLAMFMPQQKPVSEAEEAAGVRMREFFMPAYYLFVLIIAQCSNMLTAWCAANYSWQSAYYVVMAMLLVAMILIKFSMPDEEKTKPYTMEWRKVPAVLCMAVMLCSLVYVLVCGKTLDWFSSPRIVVVSALFLIATGAYVFISVNRPSEEVLSLSVLGQRNVWTAMVVFVLTMVFTSSSMFIGSFYRLSTPAGNYDSAMLSLWAIVGLVVGAVVALFMVWRRLGYGLIFCVGFVLMLAANAVMYFTYADQGVERWCALAMVLMYAGLLIPYAMGAALGMSWSGPHHVRMFVFVMLASRNAFAPALGLSVYTNWLQERQQYYTERYVQNVDEQNQQAMAEFSLAQKMGAARGESTLGSQQMATALLRQQVGTSAAISAMRSISGTTVWLLLGAMVIALFLPYKYARNG